ncbi:helix-turn-helix domain-containing protein [Candidatus Dojkabacteria bacterium]|nr:helix-turn-helix domain-containing protein [Candidatus Dojkabacteria bacterium]
MLKLGDLFKSERKQKGLSLSQVSESTKIPQRLIKALENGDYDQFSSEVYLQGFLKNYAKFLGVSINKALAIYRRERKTLNEESLDDAQKPIQEQKPIITPGRLVLTLTVLIIVSVISFIVIQINKIAQPPNLELREPISGTAPSELYAEVTKNSITLSGKVEVGSKLLINGSEVNTNNLQEFRVDNFKLNPGSNEIYIVAESYYFSKRSEIKLTVLAKYTTSEQDETESEPDTTTEETTESGGDGNEPTDVTQHDKMQIEIEVGPENAWIVATVDEVTKISDVVQPDTTFSFEAKEVFTIYSPRPQMVKLKINGEEYTFGSQTAAIFKLVNGKIVQE